MQEEIKRMEQLGVIELIDEPTEWCSPIVVVPKAHGRVRICVDLTKLNKAVRREIYQMLTVEETLGCLTEGSVVSKLDANSGFHQIVLNPESAKLTIPLLHPLAVTCSSVFSLAYHRLPNIFRRGWIKNSLE